METIFDRIRGVELKATPEELVRQRVICWLEQSGIIPECIGREVPVQVDKRNLRADIVVFGKDAKPFLLIECKAPSVTICDDTLFQVFEYNKVLHAGYVMVTNGKLTYCFKKEDEKFNPVQDLSEMFSDYLRYLR